VTLAELNRMERAPFVQALGAIFEHSPWVAERAWEQRPFASLEELHAAMCAVVDGSGEAAQMRLVRAHPRLADKAALRNGLTQDSQREQASAGLDQCSPEELARISALNDDYDRRFGFPFIVAVREHDRQGIIDAMARRLERSPEEETAEALEQIGRIAWWRLATLVER
jgi:2-oxo-4-hydroxy-4-carboxy-5-ureidoimidazoline decarboxylase